MPSYLFVDVTEGASKCARRIRDSDIWKPQKVAHSHHIINRRIPCRRNIHKRQRPCNLIPPRPQVLILPRPPQAIDHSMMEPKIRIRGRIVEVRASITRNGVVAREMDSQPARLRVLQRILEGGDVGAGLDQVGNEPVACFKRRSRVDVALDAARIVA